MSTLSNSPDRGTFAINGIVRRAKESGLDVDTDTHTQEMIQYYKNVKIMTEQREQDPAWKKDNMEYDLRSTDWILDKVRASEVYAQNLYAAMCNNEFQKLDVMPILRNDKWSCSWRYAGGIIADMRESGDYIDWYCSGIKGDSYTDDDLETLNQESQERFEIVKQFVNESYVTDEIRSDLKRLGWIVVDYDDCDT
jgi:hypothetical protein